MRRTSSLKKGASGTGCGRCASNSEGGINATSPRHWTSLRQPSAVGLHEPSTAAWQGSCSGRTARLSRRSPGAVYRLRYYLLPRGLP
jgi:hypothetical protein